MDNDMNLAIIWEWDPITGNPVIPPAGIPNARHCPTVEEMNLMTDARSVTGDDVRLTLRTFMTSKQTQMTTFFNAHESDVTKGYLRLIRALDFKKINVRYEMGGTLHLTKLPRDTPFNGQPYGIQSNMRTANNTSVYGLVRDINFNARLGWQGPGTFPCCLSRCGLCPFVGRAPTVDVGPHGLIDLTKRATCTTRNAVYVGTCRQCQAEDTFTCYFGESSTPLNLRYRHHLTDPCNSQSILQRNKGLFQNVAAKRAEIARVIGAGVDPDDVLRDWFAHITDRGVHPGHQSISVVDIQPHKFARRNRERHLVEQYMYQNGEFHYLGMGRGSLNQYAN